TARLDRVVGVPAAMPITDGVPLPPPRFVHAVVGTDDVDWFLESGRLAATNIRGLLAEQGVALETLGAILDFGCGVGRILRHWVGLRGPRLFGSDYNEELVDWCRAHLGFARFGVHELEGPL